MKKFTVLMASFLMLLALGVSGQTTIKLEDFSSTSGWALDYTFDDGSNDYCKRDQNFNGLSGYALEDGTNYFIGAEDTKSDPGSPSDGIVTLTLDQIDITGYSNLTLSLDASANTSNKYDQRNQSNGDYLDIMISIDGGAFTTVGSFCSPSGSNHRLYEDADLNGIGGDDGGAILDKTIQNFSYNISGTGSTLDVKIVFRFESGSEEIAFDNIKVTGVSASGNVPPAISNVTQTPADDVESTMTVSVSADVTDSDGTVAGVELHWGTIPGSLPNNINMSNTGGDTYTTDSDIPAQPDGTTVYYEVYALDDDADDATSPEYNYTVNDPASTTLDYSEDFTGDLGDCYVKSVSGDTHYWEHNSSDFARMNGYGSSETEEDWLVLPAINFDNYTNEKMTFDSRWRYGAAEDATHYLKLYYSTDYYGVGDPSTATWTELSFTKGASDTWTSSGDIDLSGISGTNVYIAFKYYYTDNYRRWDIDNISITQGVQPLDADFTADRTAIMIGGTVNFTDMTSGGATPYLYSWDFDGDGTEDATTQNPSYTYNTAGTYTVELYVVDDNADDDTETKTNYITVVDPPATLVINEVDADQTGTDSQEFIELFGPANYSLNGYVLVAYNGNGDVSYRAWDLDGYSLDADGYFVLGSENVPGVDYIADTNSSTNILQNGADAVALYVGDASQFPNGTALTTSDLVDALVYDTNDGDDPGLLSLLQPGEPQINEGGRGSSGTHSNQRLPNGSGGQGFTYTYDQAPPTPGSMNIAAFTDWNGDASDDWFGTGNWSHGVPSASLNAVIPDISGTGKPYPVINDPGAVTDDLVVQAGGELTIGPSGELTVNGLLSNQNGAAGIVLQSSAAGQGSLLTNDVTYMTVQTYLSADQWHGVSAPVANDTAGVFTDVYLIEYSESDSSWNFIVPVGTPLPLGEGYFAYSVSTLTGNYTANHVGVINVNDVTVNLDFTDPNPYPGGQGWNVIGNPFTCAVEWNSNWTLTNTDNTVYFWTGTQYVTMNTSGAGTASSADIPVGQGVMVHANASGASVTIPASERKHSSQGFYKESNEGLLFTIAGNGYQDKMMVIFNDEATAGFDSEYDAYKLRGSEVAPQMYMVQNGVEMTVNVLPFTNNLMIPVNLEVGSDGEYSLTPEFDNTTKVYLEDLKTGEMIELTGGESYTFFASTGDATARFILHFGMMTDTPENMTKDVNIFSSGNTVYVELPEFSKGDIVVYNVMGQQIASGKITSSLNEVEISGTGYYIVKVVTEETTTTQKVFIK